MENIVNCMVCGEELEYFQDYKDMNCIYCGKIFSSNVSCKSGHYVCDVCHSMDSVNLSMSYLLTTQSTNPMEMAILLMKSSSYHMHGPEHHFLVPGVLIAAYYNKIGEPEKKKAKLLVAKERASEIKGGSCGFYGNCGSAVGTGIFYSIITSNTPLTANTWADTNRITGSALLAIADTGGPRCCKRTAFTAIKSASKFLEDNQGIRLYDYEENPICDFSRHNKECIGLKCQYSPGNA